ncbi:MAG: ComEC/Rec2 family competence protein [Alphaproteobacteria bacterium]
MFLCDEIAAHRVQAFLFVPVLLAIGIAGYFALSNEPPVWAGLCGVLPLFGLAVWRRNYLLYAALLVGVGFSAAQWRSVVVHTPLLERELEFVDVVGDISAIEDLEKGARLVLSGVEIEGVAAENVPRKVRLKVWKPEGLAVGQRVRVLANLSAPSAPVIPDGFDFQRFMYFKSIGALGFGYKTPEVLESVPARQFDFEGLRHAVGVRINAALEGSSAALAKALMIGRRTAMDEGDMEAIRAAGLAHMLAISGLHVGLFSGFLFMAARFGMAAFAGFALRYPVKKYAAVFACAGALFYMFLAGATIPTQRAMLSVGIVFLAILLDRSPMSLRVVAFAAAVILLFFPESLMSASFQMSFSAVTALIVFYDWLRPVWARWRRSAGGLRRLGLYVLGVCMTSVVATIGTAPLTLYHFQVLSVYGVLANVLAVPILGFWVMPLAVLALLLMPFGLEGWTLMLMEPGLQAVLYLAHFVADMDGAVLRTAQWNVLALVFFVFAGLSVAILKGWLRGVFACVFLLLSIASFDAKSQISSISSKFDLVAIWDDADGQIYVSDRRKERFVRESWERISGLEIGAAESFSKEGRFENGDFRVRCDGFACRMGVEGVKISYLKDHRADILRAECAWADLVLSKYSPPDTVCAADLYTRFDVYRHGAHSFEVRNGAVIVRRVEDYRGDRPWVAR